MSEGTTPAGATGQSAARSDGAGVDMPADRPRVFPCDGCGANLSFDIASQRLECPYCGHARDLSVDGDAAIEERDLSAALAREGERRLQRTPSNESAREIRCRDCGATTRFVGTLTASECPYCGAGLQIEDAHVAADRVPVDAVLPFRIERDDAQTRLVAWVKSRWFAPSAFAREGARGRFTGVYSPYWTFDAATATSYRGERGEHYWVTVGSGKNAHRVRRTRWYPAAGRFTRFFDDVLVYGASASSERSMPVAHVRALDPWPLERCLPFTDGALAGFLSRTYDVELRDAWVEGRQRIDAALRAEVMQRIGGDEQRIHSLRADYQALTYKHLLLPVWLLAYRWKDRPYRVAVNGATGEVCGERPYSAWKIAFAVLGAAAIAAGVVAYLSR